MFTVLPSSIVNGLASSTTDNSLHLGTVSLLPALFIAKFNSMSLHGRLISMLFPAFTILTRIPHLLLYNLHPAFLNHKCVDNHSEYLSRYQLSRSVTGTVFPIKTTSCFFQQFLLPMQWTPQHPVYGKIYVRKVIAVYLTLCIILYGKCILFPDTQFFVLPLVLFSPPM